MTLPAYTPSSRRDIMFIESLEIFEKFWTDIDTYYLGPAKRFKRGIPNWDNDYGIYQKRARDYLPFIIFDSSIRTEVIKRMHEAGCSFVTQEEIVQRQDITQLWGKRANEFILQRRYGYSHPYDLLVFHVPLQELYIMRFPVEISRQYIKNMIEAGVEIVERD
jgi:hypothetical protein